MWLRWPGLLSLRLLSIMTWGFTPCWTSLWSNLPAPLTPHSILLFHRRKTSVPVTPPLWLVQTDYPGFEGGSSISPALPSAASLANTDWSKHLTHCSDLSSKPRKTFYAVYTHNLNHFSCLQSSDLTGMSTCSWMSLTGISSLLQTPSTYTFL